MPIIFLHLYNNLFMIKNSKLADKLQGNNLKYKFGHVNYIISCKPFQ